MSNEHTPDPNRRAPRQRKPEYIQISQELFDSVPQKRAWYILAYLLIQVVFFADRIYEMRYGALSEMAATGIILFFFVCYAVMYFHFVGAMRVMGYDWFIVIPTCILAFFPIVSLLPVGYMDRRLADLWDSAQKSQDQYRQKVREEQGGKGDEGDTEENNDDGSI